VHTGVLLPDCTFEIVGPTTTDTKAVEVPHPGALKISVYTPDPEVVILFNKGDIKEEVYPEGPDQA
jgi:hypothetical protein